MDAVLLFFFIQLLIAMLAVLTAGRAPSSPIFAVCLVISTTAYFIAWVRRLRVNTFERHSGGHPEASTPVSVAVTPSTVIFADNNDNDNDNGNHNDNGNQGGSEGKNSAPIPCYATTTPATAATASTTTGALSIADAIHSVTSLFRGRPSSDRDYAALPADNSVHDAHDMVTGVPISAQQKLCSPNTDKVEN
jgi:hypothetical protein